MEMHDQKYLGRGMVGAYSLSDQNARNGGRQDLEMGTTKKMKKGNQKTELRKGGRMPKLKRGTLLTERRTDSLGSEHVFQCPKKNAYLVFILVGAPLINHRALTYNDVATHSSQNARNTRILSRSFTRAPHEMKPR